MEENLIRKPLSYQWSPVNLMSPQNKKRGINLVFPKGSPKDEKIVNKSCTG